MTISSEIASTYYTGDGVTTQFPIPFKFLSADDIKVTVVVIATGAGTVLAPGQYTVTGAGNDDGGQLVYTPAITSAQKIVIQRDMPFTQDLDLQREGGLFVENIEDELDRIVMMVQQVRAELAAAAGNGQISSIVQNVTGPTSSTADRVATFSDGLGNRIKDSGKLITDFADVNHTHPENFIGKMKSTDFTVTSSASYTTDSDLQFAMAANTSYVINAKVYVSAPATPGFKIAITGPALPTRVQTAVRATDDTGSVSNAGVNSYTTTIAVNPAATRGFVVEISARVTNGANAGTFALQFAQNVANASATLFLKGSYLEYKAV